MKILRTVSGLILLLLASHDTWAQEVPASLGPPGMRASFGAPSVDPFTITDQGPGLTQEQVEKIVEERLRKIKAESAGKETALRTLWRNGFVAESEDKAFRLHIGGLMHAEAGWWNASDALMNGANGVGPLNDGAAFRRARLHILGEMYDTVTWTLEVGFENRAPQFFNAYAEFPRLPFIGTFRLGHFREPFGMDSLTSYNNYTFLERGLVQDPFVPFFNMGAMIFGDLCEQRVTYAGGVFRSNSDSFNAADFGDGNYAYTGRLTFNPLYEDEAYALHLASAYSYRVLPRLNAAGQPVASGGTRSALFTTRPEFRVNVPTFLGTGVLQATHDNLVGAELGLSAGSFLLQAEYMAAYVNDALAPTSTTRDSYFFQGFYIQTSYFLTGEHRPYVRKEGVFGAVRPRENFFLVRDSDHGPIQHGLGAWELAVRYSQVDLNSGNVEGGLLRDLTFGLNWYLNPNCRFLWNYLLIWRDARGSSADGLTQAFGARFQIEF